jgi:hypothetical protein
MVYHEATRPKDLPWADRPEDECDKRDSSQDIPWCNLVKGHDGKCAAYYVWVE